MPDSDVQRFLAPELLEYLGDAVTVIGPDWRYVYASEAAAQIIGRPVADVVGQPVWEIFPEVLGTPQYDACVRAMEQRVAEHLVWFFSTVGKWYEQHAIPVADGLLILVNDITEVRLATLRSEQLFAVGEALARAVTPREVNNALIAEAFPLIGATGGSVLLVDDERRLVRTLGWAGIDAVADDWTEYSLDLHTPGTAAYRTGRPVYVESTQQVDVEYPAIRSALEVLGPHTVAALPLSSAGSRLGSLVLTFSVTRPLSPGDKQFLETTAAMAAQALLRAKLLDTERRSISALQRSLLPNAVPEVAGLDLAVRYSASDSTSEVGGDWYDVIPLQAGGVGLVMGDVEGHDLAAAALMGLCRSAVRAYALEGHPPAFVLDRANAFLAGLALGRIVTVCYAQVHPVERLVTVVSAGHPGIQVVGDTGEVFEVPSEIGPPLGVFDDGMLWEETSSTLPAHALFVMFTDGLIETRGEDITAGLTRVREALAMAGAAGVDTVADVLLATKSSESHDDVALLTARLTADRHAARQLTRRLPATSASAFLARRSCRQLMREWSLGADVVDRVELVVSELVSNASRHTEESIDVRLSLHSDVLRLEVEDSSHRTLPRVPNLEDLDPDATSGRGLLLVDTMATRWGTESDGLGKCIWAEFALG